LKSGTSLRRTHDEHLSPLQSVAAPRETHTLGRNSVPISQFPVPKTSFICTRTVGSVLVVVVSVLRRKLLIVRQGHHVIGRRRRAVVVPDAQAVSVRLVLNRECVVRRHQLYLNRNTSIVRCFVFLDSLTL